MMKKIILIALALLAVSGLHAQFADFSKMNFGCDGNSITSGEQWSKTVMNVLGFATHHNVAVGSSTWACHQDTQPFGSENFAGISDGWMPTSDTAEIQKRHNNVAKVHIQKFIAEVEQGLYPAPDVFVFSMGTNDRNLGDAKTALKGKSLDAVDVSTMAGGARWAIQTMVEKFPKCRIFVCTPIQTATVSSNEKNLQMIAILKEICQSLSVQVIDCYGESGITEKMETGRNGRYLRDGLHPGPEGQALMGRYIAKEIRNNYF
jgi:lysophospholipase L1-like esterase